MKAPKVLLLALLALPALAHADDVTTVEATGEDAVIGDDASAQIAAQDRATKKAMREAVEQVVGVMIGSDTLTRNNSLVSDRIYSNSAGYVKKYEITSKTVEKGVARVTIRAQVGKADLNKDLQAVRALIARFGNPKIVLLTQEQAVDSNGIITNSGVMNEVLTNGFKDDGWTIIDPHFAAGKVHLSSGAALGQQEAKEIGDLAKADYILYGTVNFRYQPPNDHGMIPERDEKGQQLMFNVSGEYDIGVFATDSGSQLAKLSGKFNTDIAHAPRGSVSNVISYARTTHDIAKFEGPKIVAEVRKAALDYLSNVEQNGNRVVVSVLGMSDYAKVQSFKQVLSSENGVKNVASRGFGNGKAQFDVSYVGSTNDLADRLTHVKKLKLRVTGLTENTMELTLAK